MTYIGFQVLTVLIFIVIGGASINQVKSIPVGYRFIIIIILLNLILTIISPTWSLFNIFALDNMSNKISTDYWSIRGQIGDVLSGHFAALAFIGIMITIYQMKDSLLKQDRAIKMQQKEMKKQQKEMKKQQKEMKKQSFENKFFQMLDLSNNIINNLEYRKEIVSDTDVVDQEKYLKKEVLRELKTKFLNEMIYRNSTTKSIAHIEINDLEKFRKYFIKFNNKFSSTFKYYFINLYQILNYVDNSKYNKGQKKEYTNIIRAQLSKDQLILLFYNAIGVINFSGDRYKRLIEKYEFFEHLEYTDLKEDNNNKIIDILMAEYNENVFGKNFKLKNKCRELKITK